MACSQYASAVGFLEDADELGHSLGTWSDTAGSVLGSSVERKGQSLLTGRFATFRLNLVFKRNPHAYCVILAGGENAEMRP